MTRPSPTTSLRERGTLSEPLARRLGDYKAGTSVEFIRTQSADVEHVFLEGRRIGGACSIGPSGILPDPAPQVIAWRHSISDLATDITALDDMGPPNIRRLVVELTGLGRLHVEELEEARRRYNDQCALHTRQLNEVVRDRDECLAREAALQKRLELIQYTADQASDGRDRLAGQLKGLLVKLDALEANAARVGGGEGAPIPMRIHCPCCNTQHIDEGEFATKPHKSHTCQNKTCGLTWKVADVPTVGVRFLPGTEGP